MKPDGAHTHSRRGLSPLDVSQNRKEAKWTAGELVIRALWFISLPLFRLSPRQLWWWRRGMLRAFGARIGERAHVYPSVRITIPWNLEIGAEAAVGDRAILYALGPIRICERATVSQYAHLCAGTHDLTKPHRPLVKAQISIGADAWVCADAFVGPGVTVGQQSIVGARAVVMKDVAPFTTVAGNPAREVGPAD